MTTTLNSIDIFGLPTGGTDPVASITVSNLSFQGGNSAFNQFLADLKALIRAQDNVTRVAVTKHETVSTDI